MTEPIAVLAVEDLEVRYRGGPQAAVGGVSLTLEPGAGLLVSGDAGAGKTSLLRGVLGLTPATGTVRVGAEQIPGPAMRRCGYAPQSDRFAEGLSPREIVGLVARLRGAPAPDVDRSLDEAGIAEPLCDRPVPRDTDLPHVALACATVGDPDLLLLDQPADDAVTLAAVARARGRGGAVLVAVREAGPDLRAALGPAELRLVDGRPA